MSIEGNMEPAENPNGNGGIPSEDATSSSSETQKKEAGLINSIKNNASRIRVFGGDLLGFTGGLIGNTAHYTLDHKSEILAGMISGGGARIATRLAVRSLLAGSGGWAVAAAAGAMGGAVSGGVKEYWRQKKEIQITEAGRTFIIAGLRNEFRRIKAADTQKIAVGCGKGALFGLAGGVIGAEIVEWLATNEAAQGALSSVKEGLSEKLSGATQWVKEQASDLSKVELRSPVSIPTEGPAGTPAPGRLPTPPVASSTPEPPDNITPVPSTTEAVPAATPILTTTPAEIHPLTSPPTAETIPLPKGSNPWTEVKGYLEQNLGREPSGSEIQEAVNRVLTENNITDAHNVPPGNLKVHEVNEYIQQLRSGQPLPTAPEQITDVRAAEVGKYLPVRDALTNEALKSQGLSNAEVDSASFAKGQEAVQRIMEAKANEISGQAYADWINSEAGHKQLVEASAKAAQDQLQIEHNLAEKITDALKGNPGVFIERGVTAGEILNLSWTPIDAPVMGANIAANYDMLTDMWAEMAKVHPDLLADTNFPVSLSEINDLVKRAEAGDELAIRRLRQALHWIPAGGRFKVIAGNQAIKDILKMAA